MPRIRKLEAQAAQIAMTYTNAGFTIRQLAVLHSVSPGTIRNILKRQGTSLRKRGRRSNTNESM